MTTKLTYGHCRNLFIRNNFKPFVYKYFENYKFKGFEYGYHYPSIEISNWEEIKDILPKYAIPLKIETI